MSTAARHRQLSSASVTAAGDGTRVVGSVQTRLDTSGGAADGPALVRFVKRRPEHGLATPSVLVQIQRKDSKAKPIVLRIGAPLKEGGKVVGYYAERQGRAVVYLLGQPSVDALRKAKF